MVKNLFIFVFKTCAIFFTLSFLLLFLFHFIIQKSNFRLNKIFTGFQIKEKFDTRKFKIVILNKELFNDSNIINFSFNEFNGETIIQSLSSLNNFNNFKIKIFLLKYPSD